MNETIEKLVIKELKKARANEAAFAQKHHQNNFESNKSGGFKKLKVKFMSKMMEKKMREHAAHLEQQQQQQQKQQSPALSTNQRPAAELGGHRKTPTYL